MKSKQLSYVLERAIDGISPSPGETNELLSLQDLEQIGLVMSAARKIRENHFDNKVFLYGFVYFSTYCRNNCTFCLYRRTNTHSPRYRKSLEEVVAISQKLADSGVHLIDLTSGEDPLLHDSGDFSPLLEMVKTVKARTGLPVMVSPGVVPDEVVVSLGECGADWYALYQETHNPILYEKLRLNQSFEERKAKRAMARYTGMLVEDGLLIGVGETVADRTDSIMSMKQSEVEQVRVMSFVPQPHTPLAEMGAPSRMIEYLGIAVMRLLMPDRLIPATLDVEGIKGLKARLEAGANLVTSIIPPVEELAGVAQSTLDIEQGLRSVSAVEKILSEMNLSAASIDEYTFWMNLQKKSTVARLGEGVI
jgi:methylornithine synthase